MTTETCLGLRPVCAQELWEHVGAGPGPHRAEQTRPQDLLPFASASASQTSLLCALWRGDEWRSLGDALHETGKLPDTPTCTGCH